MIKVVLSGAPMGKQRVKFSRQSGRAYTPERTVTFESQFAWAAQEAMAGKSLMEGPLFLEVIAYLPIPESKPLKWKVAARRGEIRPTKKPDFDNILKIVSDSMNLVVWLDDAQIVDSSFKKFLSDKPRTIAIIGSAPISIPEDFD